MKYWLSSILLCCSLHSIGQTINDNVVKCLYAKTIENYFSKLSTYKKNTSLNKQFLLIKDSLPNDIPLIYKGFELKIVKNQDEAIGYLITQKEKTGAVYIISRQFKNDTLNIQISGWSINIKKVLQIRNWRLITRSVHISSGCGGTMGYIPSGRMIYNKTLNNWSFTTNNEIIAELRKSNTYQKLIRRSIPICKTPLYSSPAIVKQWRSNR